jgi:hypothetical protein
MLQAWNIRNCIHGFVAITDGKTTIARPRPRYESNIKMNFVAKGEDDINWVNFKWILEIMDESDQENKL